MNNTIMQTKSTFQDGLVMDFSPDNTQATCLTSALNATILTFNGNEMSLLNDMGNGRVETAYLPDGYVPVGTCEFGDIIYIVSYNPILNKSLIGCFPSPERNIDSKEQSQLNISTISSSDFQGSNGELLAVSKKVILMNTNLTSGDKYIIYESSGTLKDNGNILSGYGNSEHVLTPKLATIHVVSIEDSGKIVYLDSTTKWYDNYYIKQLSGSLDTVDLDSMRNVISSNYSVFSSKVSGKLALLIELDRITGFSCSWFPVVNGVKNGYKSVSIYFEYNWTSDNDNINPSNIVLTKSDAKAKVGKYLYNEETKLYVLQYEDYALESPSVNNYSPIDRIYKPENGGESYTSLLPTKLSEINKTLLETYGKKDTEDIKIKTVTLKWLELVNESTRVKIYKPIEGLYYLNLVQYNLELTSTIDGEVFNTISDEGPLLNAPVSTTISDDIINNYYHLPVIKHFYDFEYKIVDENSKDIDNSKLIYKYELTPAMPYGLLNSLAQSGSINFGKIGTKDISLKQWKYYNTAGTSTLVWGLDAYTEPGRGIAKVTFTFYDNLGAAAVYEVSGKRSYNGVFTEYIPLNVLCPNYKFKKEDTDKHKGLKYFKSANDSPYPGDGYLNSNSEYITEDSWKGMGKGNEYYTNDFGTIYSNCLYGVKIEVDYSNIDIFGNYNNIETKPFYRWFWTNTMFNLYYQQTTDFDNINFVLDFDLNAVFNTKPASMVSTIGEYSTGDKLTETSWSSLKANIETINLDGETNIEMQILAGLLNDYNGMFNLNKDGLKNILLTTYIGEKKVTTDGTLTTQYTNSENNISDGLFPVNGEGNFNIKNTSYGKVAYGVIKKGSGDKAELNASADAYLNYKNDFNISFKKEKLDVAYGFKYPGLESESCDAPYILTMLNEAELSTSSKIPLIFLGILFHKYLELFDNKTILVNKITPLLYSKEDLDTYGLTLYNNHFLLKSVGFIAVGEEDVLTTWLFTRGGIGNSIESPTINSSTLIGSVETTRDNPPSFLSESFQSGFGQSLSSIFKGIGVIFPVQYLAWGALYELSNGSEKLLKADKLTTLISPSLEWQNLFSSSFIESSNNLEINTSGTFLKSSSTIPLFTIKDKNNNLHIINNGVPTLNSSSYVSETILYKYNLSNSGNYYGEYANNITYLGDMVAALLSNVYATSGEVVSDTVLDIKNAIYLNQYSTIFLADIVNKLEVTKNENLLCILSMNFDEYVNAVKAECVGDDKFKNSKNVKLTINSIMKTTPILLKYKYYKPTITDSKLGYKYKICNSDGTSFYSNLGFYANTMYYIKLGSDLLSLLDTSFSYLPRYNWEESEDKLYLISKSKLSLVILNLYLKDNFELVGRELVCSNTSTTIEKDRLWTIHGKKSGESWGEIWPINKREVLFGEAQYAR